MSMGRLQYACREDGQDVQQVVIELSGAQAILPVTRYIE